MLKYDFKRIFIIRGISNPLQFLRKHGFTPQTANRIAHNLVGSVSLEILESLCILLKCTPNDLMVWSADKDSNLSGNLPLNELVRKDDYTDFASLCSDLSLGQIEEMMNSVKGTVNASTQNKINDSK